MDIKKLKEGLVDTLEVCLDCAKLDKSYKDFKDSAGPYKGLFVEAAATHSDKLINNRIYLRDEVSRGTNSWLVPFRKPILAHHDDVKDAIGRVVSARYVDMFDSLGPEFQRFKNMSTPVLKDVYVGMLIDRYLLQEDFKGTGFIKVGFDVTDKEAVEKVMDERYMTMSIGFDSDHMYCSICNSDWMAGEFCDHKPGDTSDGVPFFSIMGKMDYSELSFVNKPADDGALVLNKGEAAISISPYFVNSIGEKVSQFKDYVEEFNMFKELMDSIAGGNKIKLEDLYTCEDFDAAALYDALVFPENTPKLSREEIEQLPKSVFCGVGSSLPVVDLAHFDAIKDFLKNFDETKEKEKLVNKVYYRAKKLALLPSTEFKIAVGDQELSFLTLGDSVDSYNMIWEKVDELSDETKQAIEARLRVLNTDWEGIIKLAAEARQAEEPPVEAESTEDAKVEEPVQETVETQDQVEGDKLLDKIHTMFNELPEEDKIDFMSSIDTSGNDLLKLNDSLSEAQNKIEEYKTRVTELEKNVIDSKNYTTSLEDKLRKLKLGFAEAVLDLRIYLKKPGTDFSSVTREKMFEDLCSRTEDSLIDSLSDLRQELLGEYPETRTADTEDSRRNEEVVIDRGEPLDFKDFSRIFSGQRRY